MDWPDVEVPELVLEEPGDQDSVPRLLVACRQLLQGIRAMYIFSHQLIFPSQKFIFPPDKKCLDDFLPWIISIFYWRHVLVKKIWKVFFYNFFKFFPLLTLLSFYYFYYRHTYTLFKWIIIIPPPPLTQKNLFCIQKEGNFGGGFFSLVSYFFPFLPLFFLLFPRHIYFPCWSFSPPPPAPIVFCKIIPLKSYNGQFVCP